MEAIVSRSAGIDIGKAVLKATVRVQGDHGRRTRREVRSFGTTTAQLLALRDWLVTEAIQSSIECRHGSLRAESLSDRTPFANLTVAQHALSGNNAARCFVVA
jgi:hypothetical protein